ncbi:MAG TPA: zinc ribbon domain-containing protein [Smithellaceae bacterium]|nr:zinc ribbon domain-containing protein [Smithellaceae bacterium]HRS83283.1 zinc ribbon domain-containing protein [Smithellaceae bacterium]HRV45056.1 zinc ribbon domain-containing protein [Smithellaceae bacterium]
MPTYEYECSRCGLNFERHQSMNEAPVSACPECGGSVKRLVSGGTGFMMKGGSGHVKASGGCSLEETGKTCCGAASRCGSAPCGD